MDTDFDYPMYLQTKAQTDAPMRKGARTRERLKVATVNILNKIPYQDLRVTDICEEAGVAPGTFYLYFENKKVLTIEMLSEFIEMFNREIRSGIKDAYEATYHSNLFYIKTVRHNPGLMRCVLQMGDVDPEFGHFYQEVSGKWYERVTASMERWLDMPDEDVALFATHALGSMMDDWVRRYFVAKDPALLKLVKKLKLTDEGLAKHLTVIWYRTYFGKDPEGSAASIAKKMPRAIK